MEEVFLYSHLFCIIKIYISRMVFMVVNFHNEWKMVTQPEEETSRFREDERYLKKEDTCSSAVYTNIRASSSGETGIYGFSE